MITVKQGKIRKEKELEWGCDTCHAIIKSTIKDGELVARSSGFGSLVIKTLDDFYVKTICPECGVSNYRLLSNFC